MSQYPLGDRGRYVLRTSEPLKPWDVAALERDLATDEDVEAALRLGDIMRDAIAQATATFDEILDGIAEEHANGEDA